MVHSSDEKYPVSKIARDLDVSTETLRKGVNQAQIDSGEHEGLSTEEREELRRLRNEVRVLKEEREILKKVAAWARKTSNGSGSVESAAVLIAHLKGVFHRIIRDSSLPAFMRQVLWTEYYSDEGRPECLV